MRINWRRTPYYLYVMKPVFGNLGLVRDTFIGIGGEIIYRLQSVVDVRMTSNFYQHELTISEV
jgi:hypothetical protein